MGWLIPIAFVVFFIGGAKLSAKAHRFLIEPRRGMWDTPLYNKELFRPEGEPARRAAVEYWNRGTVVMVVLIAALLVLD
jgi:hypothetical protein